MSNLQVVTSRQVLGKQFIMYGDAENPLFLAKDVAEWIEHSRASEMLKTIDDEEKLVQTILASGQNREMWFLTEDGLYEVLMQSRKPIAKNFKKAVKKILKEIRRTGKYIATPNQNKTLEIKEINARVRMSNQFLKIANVDTLSTDYKNILISKATEVLAGYQLIPLPKSTTKTYSATEIGEVLGISSVMVGKLANKHDLKTKEYGEVYRDKSKYSSKEVDTFRYYENIIPTLQKILKKNIAV